MKRIMKFARYLTILGLILLLVPMLFDISAPNPLFSVLVGLGLLFIFATLMLYLYIWIKGIGHALARKDFLLLVVLLILAVILIYDLI